MEAAPLLGFASRFRSTPEVHGGESLAGKDSAPASSTRSSSVRPCSSSTEVLTCQLGSRRLPLLLLETEARERQCAKAQSEVAEGDIQVSAGHDQVDHD